MTERVHLRKKRKYLSPLPKGGRGLFWLCVSFLCVVCATGIAFAQTPQNNKEILVVVDISGSMGEGNPTTKLQSAQRNLENCLRLTNSTAQVYGFYSYEGESDVLRWEEIRGGVGGLRLPPNSSQTLSPLDQGLSEGFEILTSSRREAQLWFVTDEIFDTGTGAPVAELIRKFRELLEQNEDFPWVCYYQFDDVPGRPYRMYIMLYYDKKHVTYQEHDTAVRQFLGYVDGLSSKLGIKAVLYKFHLPLREKTVLFNVSDMSPWKGYAGDALNPAFDFYLYYRPQSFNMQRSKLTFDNEQRLSVKGFPQTDYIDSSQYQTKAIVKPEDDYTILTPGDTISLANVAYGKSIPITLGMTNIPSLNLSLKDWKEVFFSFESGGKVTWDASFTVSDATFNPVEGKYPNIDMSKISEGECLPQTTKPQKLLLTYSFPVFYPTWVWVVRIFVWVILPIALVIGIIVAIKAVSGQQSASSSSGVASVQPIKTKQSRTVKTKIKYQFKKLP